MFANFSKIYFFIIDKIKFVLISILSDEKKFKFIYKSKYWKNESDGSLSGAGSNISSTKQIISSLQEFLVKNEIKSLLDVPCGDWMWMKKINLGTTSYIGGDIVTDIIETNNLKHGNEYVKFQVIDIRTDKLGEHDLLVVRDLLIHFHDAQIKETIINIKKNNFKYIAITNHPDTQKNIENNLGDNWRPVNLLISPFNLPKPDIILPDVNTADPNPNAKHKNLSIWRNENFKLDN